MENVSLLVRRAQGGSLESFAELVKRFQDMTFTIAYVRLGDESLAKDAAQEGLIEAYLHIQSLKEAEAFASWLRRIVLRQCTRIQRGKTVETVSLENALDISGDQPDPFDIVVNQETLNVVRGAVDALPEQERVGILLHYISGYSQQQIAEFLDVPASTLRKRLQHARERLKEKLTTMSEDYFERRPSEDEKFSKRVQFFIAVRTGNYAEVTEQLKGDASLATATERWSETLAQLYPRAQPTEEMKAVFESRRLGWTPLYWAVLAGNTKMVQLLLDYGAKIDDSDWRGVSALLVAIWRNDQELLSLLIQQGADPNSAQTTRSPLHAAAALDNVEIATSLLGYGAEIDYLDRFGRTALFWAAIPGHLDMVKFLLESGANVDVKDEKGRSARWWAEHSGHSEIVQVLDEVTEQ